MQIIASITDMQQLVSQWDNQGLRIGFVPTMGNLHLGHLALVKRAQKLSDKVVVSIFVNPLQFDRKDDFAAYSRTLDDDRDKLIQAGVDVLFVPSEQQMYPKGREAEPLVDIAALAELCHILEGASRPGHFIGVATVVNKLFQIVSPHTAIFGEKDFQQLLVIRKMVAALDLSLEIVTGETVREPDGLAMSTRNGHLNTDDRRKAPQLYETLKKLHEQLRNGVRDHDRLEQEAVASLQRTGFQPDYVSIRRHEDLQPPQGPDDKLVTLAAAWLGRVRLIDNVSWIPN